MSSAFRKPFRVLSLSTIKKFPELVPLVGIIGFAASICGAYCVYSVVQKSDVMVNRSSKIFPWERVNPEEKQKFLTRHQEYRAIPEKEKLYQEIGPYKF